MKADIMLARAVGTEFLNRKFKAVVLLFVVVAVVIVSLLVWLTTLNAWWWLLAAPGMALVLIGVVICLAAWFALRIIRPVLTTVQATGVTDFVDKLERVADNLQTPMFLIVFRVLRDIIRPREQTFLQELATDSQTLQPDFARLGKEFK